MLMGSADTRGDNGRQRWRAQRTVGVQSNGQTTRRERIGRSADVFSGSNSTAVSVPDDDGKCLLIDACNYLED